VDLKTNEKRMLKISKRLTKERLWENIIEGKVKISELFSTDPDILMMKKNVIQKFLDTYADAYEKYISGDWHRAKQLFEEAEKSKG